MADKIYEDGGLITKRFACECPFSGDCSDVSTDRCRYCKNNKKRSYYELRYEPPQNPVWYYYDPHYPLYPNYPYWPDYFYWPNRTTMTTGDRWR